LSDRTPEETGPARPLVGYRDTGAGVILAILAAFYLGWTLTVYFLEPGLR